MQTSSLSDSIGDLLNEVDRLAAQHREAEQYTAASERLQFLQGRLDELGQGLAHLRAIARRLRDTGDHQGWDLWLQTCAELRQKAPPSFESPGKAIVDGGLDLLRLVDYTGASIATVRERTGQIQKALILLCPDAAEPSAADRGRKI